MSSSSKKRDFTTSIPSPTAKKPRSQTHTRSGALVEGGIAITLKMNKMRSRQQVDIANVDLDHEQILKEQQAAYKIVDSKSILSKELADDLVPSYSNEQQGNDLILDGSKTEQTRLKKLKKGKRRTIELTAAELEKARKLKRAKERKKELYKERKQKLLKRDKLLESIKEKSLSNQELQLFQSSRNLGREETMREKLKRALNERKAGIVTANDVEVLKERTVAEYEDWADVIEKEAGL